MGSFNTSCMVSQQVIVPGAQTVILPIQQQATYEPVEISKDGKEMSQFGFAHTTCYPTAFWGYAGPMIRGTYDDYGRFNIDDTVENKINLISFFNELTEKAFVTKQGENQYHDHGFDIHTLYNTKQEYSFSELVNVWEKVWDVVQENRIFISNYQGEPRNLQFAVIHRAAADYLIDSVGKLTSYSGQSYEQKSYFKNYIQSQLTRMVELFKEKKKLSDTFSFFGSQMASLSNYRIGEQEGAYISHYYDNFNPIMDAIEQFNEKNPATTTLSDDLIDSLFEIFKPQIQHRYLHMGLDHLNIKLSPMVYASQDYDNDTGKSFAKMIRSVSAQVNKEIKENRDW